MKNNVIIIQKQGKHSTVGTEEQWTQRNSGHRNSGHRRTVGTGEQWVQKNSGHRGTDPLEG